MNLIDELRLAPEKIQQIILEVSKQEGFDDAEGYKRIRAEDYVKAGANAQLDKCQQQASPEVLEEIIQERIRQDRETRQVPKQGMYEAVPFKPLKQEG